MDVFQRMYDAIVYGDNKTFHQLYNTQDASNRTVQHLFFFHYLTQHGEAATWEDAIHVWTNPYTACGYELKTSKEMVSMIRKWMTPYRTKNGRSAKAIPDRDDPSGYTKPQPYEGSPTRVVGVCVRDPVW